MTSTSLTKLPSSEDAERECLSAVFIDERRAMPILVEILTPEDFYFERHRRFYLALLGMRAAGTAIDPVTLNEVLRSSGDLDKIGGVRAVSDLIDRKGTVENVRHYAQIVRRKARERRIVEMAHSVTNDVMRGDDDSQGQVEHHISEMARACNELRVQGTPRRTWKGAVHEAIKRACGEGEKARRLPFGIDGLDDKLNGGLADSSLTVVNALSGGGKTALAINNLAYHAGSSGRRVHITSLEMTDEELAERSLARFTGIESWQFEQGVKDSQRHSDVIGAGNFIAGFDFVVDEESVSIADVRTRVMAAHAAKPIDLVIIDYAQLVTNGKEGEADLATTTRGAKRLAKALRCPVVLLVQSTLAANRTGKAPEAADAKGSQAIMADADNIIVPHIIDPEDSTDRPDLCPATISVRKQRKGKRGVVKDLFFDGPRCMFRARSGSDARVGGNGWRT